MELSFDNNIPIYIQLLEYLKIYLISGVFKSGEKLPSVREFSTTFKVNPNTIIYGEPWNGDGNIDGSLYHCQLCLQPHCDFQAKRRSRS